MSGIGSDEDGGVGGKEEFPRRSPPAWLRTETHQLSPNHANHSVRAVPALPRQEPPPNPFQLLPTSHASLVKPSTNPTRAIPNLWSPPTPHRHPPPIPHTPVSLLLAANLQPTTPPDPCQSTGYRIPQKITQKPTPHNDKVASCFLRNSF